MFPGPPVFTYSRDHLHVPTLVLRDLGHPVWAVSSVVSSLACPWLREAAQACSHPPGQGEAHLLWSRPEFMLLMLLLGYNFFKPQFPHL